ncbi:MAG: lipopolysaccharide transport periplasmic protein LptA [Syntrophus sp. PtaB.Bin001]|nr:MAG: lipopolysaccharide transport periplasmic protein LptA [Syntrophus sp. PtaB.Bin001]
MLFLINTSNLTASEPKQQKKNPVSDKEPIRIDSDRLDAFNDQRLVVFSGNAVAVQGDKVLKSDKILLYFKKKEAGPQKGVAKEANKAGDLDRIEAKGHVQLTQGERVVTGEDAVYFQDTQKIVVTGNPVMREKKNVVRGDRIIVFVNEDRGIVESLQRKRVSATIYPSEKDEGKK